MSLAQLCLACLICFNILSKIVWYQFHKFLTPEPLIIFTPNFTTSINFSSVWWRSSQYLMLSDRAKVRFWFRIVTQYLIIWTSKGVKKTQLLSFIPIGIPRKTIFQKLSESQFRLKIRLILVQSRFFPDLYLGQVPD